MEGKNLWLRRSNNNSLSLNTSTANDSTAPQRDYSSLASRRNGSISGQGHGHGRPSHFNNASPGSVVSPVASGGSSAFALGSGAFASFGPAKNARASGNPIEHTVGTIGIKTPSTDKFSKESPSIGGSATKDAAATSQLQTNSTSSSHPLPEAWVFWTRPPISKVNGYLAYEKTLHPIAEVKTVEEFGAVYRHLKPPSALPVVTDYHFFKKGVRPIWEDDENKKGGKWVLKLKKGVADRYWLEILLACIGDGFGDSHSIVNGAVLSVRHGEDIISIWTSTSESKMLKIRDAMRTVLDCPPNTSFEHREHALSLEQRAAADEQRKVNNAEKRAIARMQNDAQRKTVEDKRDGDR